MWFIGVEVEQETSAPPTKKHPASAPDGAPPKQEFKEYYGIFHFGQLCNPSPPLYLPA